MRIALALTTIAGLTALLFAQPAPTSPSQDLCDPPKMAPVNDPMLAPGFCERARDAERQRIQSAQQRQGCNKLTLSNKSWCQAHSSDLKDSDANFRKCQDHGRETARLREQAAQAQRKLEEGCRQKDGEIRLRPTAPPPRSSTEAFKKWEEANKQYAKQMQDALRSQANAARDQAVDDLAKASKGLEKGVKYGKGTKQADGIGKSDESFDDMVGDPPVDTARPEGGSSQVVLRNNRVAPDNSCPADYQLATMSCRIVPSSRAVQCQSLVQVGSTAGADCLGSIACCVPARDAFLLPKDDNGCPSRTCWGRAGKDATDCPKASAKAEAACAINWGPTDWPSVASCPKTTAVTPTPPSTPSDVWTAATCTSYEAQLAAWSADVDLMHRKERDQRIAQEAAGQNITCPHACTHGGDFETIAASLESLNTALDRARGTLSAKNKKCGGSLQQAALYARPLASDLRWWIVQPMKDFAWDTDTSRGPYTVWSGIEPKARPYDEATWAGICSSLAAFESCVATP